MCIWLYSNTTTSVSCVNSASLDRIVAHTSIVVCRFTSRHKTPSQQPELRSPHKNVRVSHGHGCAQPVVLLAALKHLPSANLVQVFWSPATLVPKFNRSLEICDRPSPLTNPSLQISAGLVLDQRSLRPHAPAFSDPRRTSFIRLPDLPRPSASHTCRIHLPWWQNTEATPRIQGATSGVKVSENFKFRAKLLPAAFLFLLFSHPASTITPGEIRP